MSFLLKLSKLEFLSKLPSSSLGEAHAEMTNALFLHLGKPAFLMCPVEYSGNRASPSVTKSEYLDTLGSVQQSRLSSQFDFSVAICRNC